MLSVAVQAQDDDKNLVQNPGFETIDGRLKKPKQIEVAKHWVSPTAEPADLYSSLGGELVSTPANPHGHEEPFEGQNYAGVRIYSYNGKVPRTYLATQLLGPLKKGMQYCVSFRVNLSDLSKYASNNIQAHLSKKPLESEEKVSLILGKDAVHAQHSKNKVFNAQYGWESVCTIYTANGGEKWLTIGNFVTDKETDDQNMKKPREFKQKQTYDAYYFIDDVQVFMLDSVQECNCEGENLNVEDVEVVYTAQVISKTELKLPELVEASTLYFYSEKPDLTDRAKEELDILAMRMTEDASVKLELHAHSDAKETAAGKANPLIKYMAQKRANVVLKYMEEKGIDKTRFAVTVHDDAKPAEDGDDPMSLAKNRRIEFNLVE